MGSPLVLFLGLSSTPDKWPLVGHIMNVPSSSSKAKTLWWSFTFQGLVASIYNSFWPFVSGWNGPSICNNIQSFTVAHFYRVMELWESALLAPLLPWKPSFLKIWRWCFSNYNLNVLIAKTSETDKWSALSIQYHVCLYVRASELLHATLQF